MKTAVIAPIGLSPPVITEFVDGIGEPISDVVLFVTGHSQVMAGANLVKAALALKFPYLRVHTESLPYDDITTDSQNFQFMKVASRIFAAERERYHCDKIYLNVAGGRKNMCITLALVGQLLAADGVFHVVNKNVEVINQRLEQHRRYISQFTDNSDPEGLQALYETHRDIFETLLFPDRRSYDIIRIPTLPYPADYLGYIIEGMKNRGAGLSGEDKDLLSRHGMMDRIGNHSTITKHGEQFLEVIFQR